MTLDASTFWTAYLTAVVFWLGTSLGCLGIALLHAVTGGRWGHAIARELRAGIAAGAVSLMAVLPLAFAAAMLYPGAESETASVLNKHQQQYYSTPFVAGRVVLVIVVWAGLGAGLLRMHARRRNDPGIKPSARKAALGLVAFWLTVTVAVIDGVMSLFPGWFSSLFPVMEIVGFAVAGMALAIVVRRFEKPPEDWTEDERQRTHDLGNMLQAFNMVWVYLAFSQYLIIWSGDLPYEVSWYIDRRDPMFAAGATALFALHFVVPFGLLLSRDLKRNIHRLAGVAGLLLVMRLVAIAWTILPTTDSPILAGVLTLLLWAVLGAVWLLVFRAVKQCLPVIPVAPTHNAAHQNSEAAEGTS